MLSAGAEALSEAKGKHLFAQRDRPFAEFTLSGAKVLSMTGLSPIRLDEFVHLHNRPLQMAIPVAQSAAPHARDARGHAGSFDELMPVRY